jgi:hypothetical protein
MPRRSGQEAASPSAAAESQPAGRRARGRNAENRPSPPQTADAVSRSVEQQAAPAYDDIARRAYELYQERGGNEGQEVDDWLRAEAELREGRGRRDDEL